MLTLRSLHLRYSRDVSIISFLFHSLSSGPSSTLPRFFSLPGGPSFPSAFSVFRPDFIGGSDAALYSHFESHLFLWASVDNLSSYISKELDKHELVDLGDFLFYSFLTYRTLFLSATIDFPGDPWDMDLIRPNSACSCGGFILLEGDKVLVSDREVFHDYSPEWESFSTSSFNYDTPTSSTILTLKFYNSNVLLSDFS